MLNWLDMRITSLFSIDIKWWLPKMETRRPEMRDWTSGFHELSLKCTGISCGCCDSCRCAHYLRTCSKPLLWIRKINALKAQNGSTDVFRYYLLLNVTSYKRAGCRACEQNKACFWSAIGIVNVARCSRKRKAWFSVHHIYHIKSAVHVKLR
jgi:hypothetical protein